MTPLLLDALMRSSVLLLAGLAGVAMVRRGSAALRHWLLAATIAAAAGYWLVAAFSFRRPG